MSTKSPIILKKHTIWYKFEDRHPSSLRQLPGSDFTSLCQAIKQNSGLSEPADSLILRVKQAEPDSAFITLNDDYFRNQLNSSFKHLVEKFGIKTYNPIIVTLLGMSCFHFVFLMCHDRIETQQNVVCPFIGWPV